MRVDFNGKVKSTKGLAKNAAVFVSKNKHAFIEGGLAGVLGAVGIDSFMKEKKHKEKDRLYQKEIQKQNAEIAVLKDAVDEAEELKKVNAVLVDVIEELKDEDAEADSNIS